MGNSRKQVATENKLSKGVLHFNAAVGDLEPFLACLIGGP